MAPEKREPFKKKQLETVPFNNNTTLLLVGTKIVPLYSVEPFAPYMDGQTGAVLVPLFYVKPIWLAKPKAFGSRLGLLEAPSFLHVPQYICYKCEEIMKKIRPS